MSTMTDSAKHLPTFLDEKDGCDREMLREQGAKEVDYRDPHPPDHRLSLNDAYGMLGMGCGLKNAGTGSSSNIIRHASSSVGVEGSGGGANAPACAAPGENEAEIETGQQRETGKPDPDPMSLSPRRYSYSDSRDAPVPQSAPILHISFDNTESSTIDDEEEAPASISSAVDPPRSPGGSSTKSPPQNAFPPPVDDVDITEESAQSTPAALRALLGDGEWTGRDAESIRDSILKQAEQRRKSARQLGDSIVDEQGSSVDREYGEPEDGDFAPRVYGGDGRRVRGHLGQGEPPRPPRGILGAKLLRNMVPTFAPRRNNNEGASAGSTGGSGRSPPNRKPSLEPWRYRASLTRFSFFGRSDADGDDEDDDDDDWGQGHGSMPPPEPRYGYDPGLNRAAGSLDQCCTACSRQMHRHSVWVCVLGLILFVAFVIYGAVEEAYTAEFWGNRGDGSETEGAGSVASGEGGSGKGGGDNNNGPIHGHGHPNHNQARIDEISRVILDAGISSSSSLEPPPEHIKHAVPTPQYRAVHWLALSDPARLDPAEYDPAELLQRYALATFWFAAHRDQQHDEGGGFVRGKDRGAPRQQHDRTKPQQNHESQQQSWKAAVHWMSERDVCEWHGVQCDPSKSKVASGGQSTAGGGSDQSGGVSLEGDEEGLAKAASSQSASGPDQSSSISGEASFQDADEEGDNDGQNRRRHRRSRRAAAARNAANNEHDSSTDKGLITHLELPDNDIVGELLPPELFAALTEMCVLDLSDNSLKGSLPGDGLSKSNKLEVLNLSGNELTGTVPRTVRDLTSLTELDLSENLLSGSLPSYDLAQLGGSLRLLSLFGNALTGTLSPVLGTLTELRVLDAHSNELRGSVPDELRRLHKLASLDLGDNILDGRIPPELWQLRELRELKLGDNRLAGPLPGSFEELTHLEILDLGDNDLDGTLPVDWSRMGRLRTLRLDGNELRGTIPPRWGLDLAEMRELDLSDNAIEGSIPSELGHMKSLEKLVLSHNDLTGTIPSSLATSGNLLRLNLEGNDRLIGEMPESICMLKLQLGKLMSLTVECESSREEEEEEEEDYAEGWDEELTEGVLCECCTDCDY